MQVMKNTPAHQAGVSIEAIEINNRILIRSMTLFN